MDKEKIGSFIRALRVEKHMKQQDLADAVFVSRQAVSLWERGKTIPDSSILCLLSEFFDVSVNEILKGEQVTHETKKDLEETTLKIIDEYNKKTLNIKRIIKISISIILVLIISFLIYYFISSYNSINVYKVEGSSQNFFTNNGIIISTRQKSYIRLGKLKSYIDINIKNVELYYIKDNKKVKIYEDNSTDILITENYGYDDYFSKDKVKYILNNLYLEIEYNKDNKDKKEILNLKVTNDFSNNKIIYLDKFKSSSSENNISILSKFKNKILDSSIYKGKNNYEKEDNIEKIYFKLSDKILIVKCITKSTNTEEIWYISLVDNTYIEYRKYKETKEIMHKYLRDDSFNKDKENEYKKLIKIMKNYLEK
ncbi:MAG: helix-turn-helix transcriptional regulator [Mollicutes bacterium]|nr:helix-turn-helix transcriptional regulator [Mollicutes bacterium]